jgi:hypothetical protein
MNILDVTGTPHPKAKVDRIDAANGVAFFQWLDADENPMGSTGVVAMFTPVLPDEDGNYAEPSDETLIAAIEGA